MPRFDLLVRGRLQRCCSTKCRYSKESGSCMTLPTGCRRSRDCCSLYNRRSIDSFDDESSRNSGGVGAGSTVSTLHNEKCIVSNPGWAQTTGPRFRT